MQLQLSILALIIPLSMAITLATVLSARQKFFYLLPVCVWTLSAATALYNPFNFAPISLETILLIALFLTTYSMATALGVLISRTLVSARSSSLNNAGDNQSTRAPRTVSAKFVNVIIYFLSFFYGVYLIRSISYLISNGASAEYRMLAMGYGTDSVIFFNSIESFFFLTVVRGVLFIFICVASYTYFFEKNKKLIALAGLLMAADSVITFGRYFVYIFALVFITGSIASNKQLLSKGPILIASIALAIIALLSAGRFDEGLSIIDFIYRYFVGYHIYGVFLLDNLITGGISYSPWYGGATLSGFLFIATKPLDIAGFDIPLFLSSATAYQQSQLIRLGESEGVIFTANAFYTMVSDMYIDGGVAAIIGFTMVLGFIYGRAIHLFDRTVSLQSFSIVLMLLICFFFSILKNQLSQFYIIIALSFFYIVPVSLYTTKKRNFDPEDS